MKVYQIKVSLNEIQPSIWRRFLKIMSLSTSITGKHG